MQSLQQLKDLYTAGMRYAMDHFSSPFYDKNTDLCNYQIKLANNATDLTMLMNVVSMSNQTFGSAFDDPKSICTGCELGYTGIQFGVGSIGWYFIYGIAGDYVFNVTLMRCDIAPPQVLNGVKRSDAVAWNIGGGYGKVNGPFYSLSNEFIQMEYDETSYSTFTLKGTGDAVNCDFGTIVPMQFYLNLTFTDSNAAKHTISVTMNCNTRPLNNYPGACLCGPGAGTFYYSYTDVDCTFTESGSATVQGKAWIDHQLMKFGPLNSLYLSALQTAQRTLSPIETSGWLWFSLVDTETGLQYMLFHALKKFYTNAISVNDELSVDMCNVYKEGAAYIYPTAQDMNYKDAKITLLDTFNSNGINLPAKYRIVLPGGKVVIAKIASSPNIYTDSYASCENPGYLWDSTETSITGICLLEANWYMTNKQVATRLLINSGGVTDDSSVSLLVKGIENPQTVWQKFLAFAIVLFPLFVLVFILYYVFRKNDDRLRRVAISVVVLLLTYYMYLTTSSVRI